VRLYLAVLEGDSPMSATPIFATEDKALIRAVAEALSRRMEDRDGAVDRILAMTGTSTTGGKDV
jgi:hypothetical protein